MIGTSGIRHKRTLAPFVISTYNGARYCHKKQIYFHFFINFVSTERGLHALQYAEVHLG